MARLDVKDVRRHLSGNGTSSHGVSNTSGSDIIEGIICLAFWGFVLWLVITVGGSLWNGLRSLGKHEEKTRPPVTTPAASDNRGLATPSRREMPASSTPATPYVTKAEESVLAGWHRVNGAGSIGNHYMLKNSLSVRDGNDVNYWLVSDSTVILTGLDVDRVILRIFINGKWTKLFARTADWREVAKLEKDK
ncbi:hypothetical protein AGMMS50225_05310 [Betaproteobacteria bacterium]|nr:hypothetical protein AGMMS50225_05310 [Betaproteobacteria bacterium]